MHYVLLIINVLFLEKDVSRTDRTHPFYEGENNANIQMLQDILMTYCMYNFDLGNFLLMIIFFSYLLKTHFTFEIICSVSIKFQEYCFVIKILI